MIDRAAVDSFVRSTCAERPESHGHGHMVAVAQLAAQLNEQNQGTPAAADADLVYLVAMLHDVADHKYDHEGNLMERVQNFLASLLPTAEESNQAWRAIDTISFSKEKKLGRCYYNSLLRPEWLVVRNVVSDADKILALGREGLLRCRQYACEHRPLTELEQYQHVVQHGKDKLFQLSEDYMRTPAGQAAGQAATKELMVAIMDWSLQMLVKQ